MKIHWLRLIGPDVDRFGFSSEQIRQALVTTGIKTRTVLVTGLDRDFVDRSFADGLDAVVELPPGAQVHEMPCDLEGYEIMILANARIDDEGGRS